MPFTLCTAFTEEREYAQLQNQYADGTIQRSQLAQTSRRTFKLAKRLNATQLSALYTFLAGQNFGATPFLFYDPFDVLAGQEIGSNFDPTGNNPQGRVTVRVPHHDLDPDDGYLPDQRLKPAIGRGGLMADKSAAS
jgi:hypothetical protein